LLDFDGEKDSGEPHDKTGKRSEQKTKTYPKEKTEAQKAKTADALEWIKQAVTTGGVDVPVNWKDSFTPKSPPHNRIGRQFIPVAPNYPDGGAGGGDKGLKPGKLTEKEPTVEKPAATPPGGGGINIGTGFGGLESLLAQSGNKQLQDALAAMMAQKQGIYEQMGGAGPKLDDPYVDAIKREQERVNKPNDMSQALLALSAGLLGNRGLGKGLAAGFQGMQPYLSQNKADLKLAEDRLSELMGKTTEFKNTEKTSNQSRIDAALAAKLSGAGDQFGGITAINKDTNERAGLGLELRKIAQGDVSNAIEQQKANAYAAAANNRATRKGNSAAITAISKARSEFTGTQEEWNEKLDPTSENYDPTMVMLQMLALGGGEDTPASGWTVDDTVAAP